MKNGGDANASGRYGRNPTLSEVGMQSGSRGFCRISGQIAAPTQIPGSIRWPARMRCTPMTIARRLCIDSPTRASPAWTPVDVAVSDGLHRRRTLTTKDKPNVLRRTPLANLFGKSYAWHVRCTHRPNASRFTFRVGPRNWWQRVRTLDEVQPLPSNGRLPAERAALLGETAA